MHRHPMDSPTSTIPDGKVKVAVRIRPLSQREIDGGCQRCTTIHPETSSITLGGRIIEGGRGRGTAPRSFTFNSVYDENTQQENIYNDLAAPLVTSFLNGYNGTIFAYGQTGSGKTHTMGSAVSSSVDSVAASSFNHNNTLGIIPRVAKDIFDHKNKVLAASVVVSSNTDDNDENHTTTTTLTSSENISSLLLPPHRLTASFIEIYNEKIRDLLAPLPLHTSNNNPNTNDDNDAEDMDPVTTSTTSNHRPSSSHPPRTDRFGNVMPDGVTEREISNLQDIHILLAEGARRRATETTKMNAVSSRSHAILTFKLEIFENGTDLQTVRSARGDCPTYSLSSGSNNNTTANSSSNNLSSDEQQRLANIGLGSHLNQPQYAKLPGPQPIKTSLFRLVDLAGSERLSQTQATGQRATEGKNINLSLLTLTKVITALSEAAEQKALQQQLGENIPPQQKRSKVTNTSSTTVTTHIPFRESRLTQLLTNSLGGNSQTVFIACASPADENHDQTRSTLEYAASAAKIKNKPTLSIDPNLLAAQLIKDNLALATNELIRLYQEGTTISPHILTTLQIHSQSSLLPVSSSSSSSTTTLPSTAVPPTSITAFPPSLPSNAFTKEYTDNRLLTLTNELNRANAAAHAAQTSELKLRNDLTKLVESARLLHAQLEAQQSILGKLQDDYDAVFQDRATWRNKTEHLQTQIQQFFTPKQETSGGNDDTLTLNREEMQTWLSSLGLPTTDQTSTSSLGSSSTIVQELADEVLDLRRKADESNVALAVMEAAQRIHSETNILRKAGIVSSNTLNDIKSNSLSSKSDSPSSTVKGIHVGHKRERSVDNKSVVSDNSDKEDFDDKASVDTGRRSFSPAHVVQNDHDLGLTNNVHSSTDILIDLPTDDEILAALEHNATVRSLQHTANDLAANIRAETQREDDILQRYHALIHSSSSPSHLSTPLSSSFETNPPMDSFSTATSTTPPSMVPLPSSTTVSSTAPLSTASAILASMEAQHAAALADADAASQRMHDLMNDLHTRGARIDHLQMELRMVQDEAEMAEKEHAAELAELRLALSTDSAHPMKHHSRVAAAQARVMNAKARQDHTEKQLATLRAEVTTLTLDKQRLQRTVDEAKARAKEFDRLRADLENSNRAKVKLAHQVEDNARKLRIAKEEARTHAAIEQRARAEEGKERASLRSQVDTLLRLVGRLESEVAVYKANNSRSNNHPANILQTNTAQTNLRGNNNVRATSKHTKTTKNVRSTIPATENVGHANNEIQSTVDSVIHDDNDVPLAFANDDTVPVTNATTGNTRTTKSTDINPSAKLRRGHSSLVPGAISGAARQAVLKTLSRNEGAIMNAGSIPSENHEDTNMDTDNLFDLSVPQPTNHKYRSNLIEGRQASAVAASSALIAEALTTIVAAMNKREDPSSTSSSSNIHPDNTSSVITNSNTNIMTVPLNTTTDDDGGFAALLGLSGDTLVDELEAINFEGPDDLPYQRQLTTSINPTSSSSTTAISGPFGGAGTATARARAEEASARRLAGARRAAATIARVVYLNVNRNHIRTLRATAIAERRTLANELNHLKKTSSSTEENPLVDNYNQRITRLSNRIATLNHRLQEIDDTTRRESLDGNKWVTRVLQAHAPINLSATSMLSNLWMQADKEANIVQYNKGTVPLINNRSTTTNNNNNNNNINRIPHNYSTQHLINDPYMRSTWITAPRPEALLPWLISIIARQSSKLKMLQASLRAVALRENNGGVTATALLQATIPSILTVPPRGDPPSVTVPKISSLSNPASSSTTATSLEMHDIDMNGSSTFSSASSSVIQTNTEYTLNDDDDSVLDDGITDFHPIGSTGNSEASLLLPLLASGPDSCLLPVNQTIPSSSSSSSLSLSSVPVVETVVIPTIAQPVLTSVPSFAIVQDEGDDVWGNINNQLSSESRRNSAESVVSLSTTKDTSESKDHMNPVAIEVDEDGFVISSSSNTNSTVGNTNGFGLGGMMNSVSTIVSSNKASSTSSVVTSLNTTTVVPSSTRQSVIFHSTKTMKAVNAPHVRHTTTTINRSGNNVAPPTLPTASIPTDTTLRSTSRGRQGNNNNNNNSGSSSSTINNESLPISNGSTLSSTTNSSIQAHHRRSDSSINNNNNRTGTNNENPPRRSSVTNEHQQRGTGLVDLTTDATNYLNRSDDATTMMIKLVSSNTNADNNVITTATNTRTSMGSNNGKEDTGVVRSRRQRAGSNGRKGV